MKVRIRITPINGENMLRNLLAELDSPGGHVIASFMVMVMGAVFFKFGVPKSEDLIVAGLALFGRAMMGVSGSKTPTTEEGKPV